MWRELSVAARFVSRKNDSCAASRCDPWLATKASARRRACPHGVLRFFRESDFFLRTRRTGKPIRSRAMKRLCLLAAIGSFPLFAAAPPPPADDGALLRGLEWRNIGPFRGGRVTAVAGVPGQPLVYYFGGTGGGVWKTTDGGINWKAMSDGQLATGSVGAIAVAESDPNVVYAGMGESCIRGNVSHGDGVYKSHRRGARPGRHVGLRDTRQIGRVRVHPRDPDLVYVAALGHTFGPNKERGRLPHARTAAPPGRTSCSWTTRPAPWTWRWTPPTRACSTPPSGRRSARPGASRAAARAAASRSRRTAATPGRSSPARACPRRACGAASASPSRPRREARVWAIIEAEDGGRLPLRRRRPDLAQDQRGAPPAPARLVLHARLRRPQERRQRLRAERGLLPLARRRPDLHRHPGAARRQPRPVDRARGPAADDQAPTTAGANVSFDGGASWSRQDNQPTAQFYHVITDDRFPYRVYGAQQDNSTVAIASRTARAASTAPTGTRWAAARAATSRRSPDDPRVVYAGCYGGYISRYDHRTGQTRNITVYPDNPMGHGAEGMKYRFQWTFPIVVSPHDPQTSSTRRATSSSRARTRARPGRRSAPTSPATIPRRWGPPAGPSPRTTPASSTTARSSPSPSRPSRRACSGPAPTTGSSTSRATAARAGRTSRPRTCPSGAWSARSIPRPTTPATLFLAVNRYKLDDYRPYAYVTNDYGKTWRVPRGQPPARRLRARGAPGPGAPGDPALRRNRDRRATSRSTAARAGSRCRWRCQAPARPQDWRAADGGPAAGGARHGPGGEGRRRGGRHAGPLLLDPRRHRAAAPAGAGGGGGGRAPVTRRARPCASSERRASAAAARPTSAGTRPAARSSTTTSRREPKENEEVTLEFLDVGGRARPQVLEQGQGRGGGPPETTRTAPRAAGAAAAGEGGAQPLHLGPAPAGRGALQGHDPVGRRDAGPGGGARPLPGAAHGGRQEPDPAAGGAWPTRAWPPAPRTTGSSSTCCSRSATS